MASSKTRGEVLLNKIPNLMAVKHNQFDKPKLASSCRTPTCRSVRGGVEKNFASQPSCDALDLAIEASMLQSSGSFGVAVNFLEGNNDEWPNTQFDDTQIDLEPDSPEAYHPQPDSQPTGIFDYNDKLLLFQVDGSPLWMDESQPVNNPDSFFESQPWGLDSAATSRLEKSMVMLTAPRNEAQVLTAAPRCQDEDDETQCETWRSDGDKTLFTASAASWGSQPFLVSDSDNEGDNPINDEETRIHGGAPKSSQHNSLVGQRPPLHRSFASFY